MPEAIITIVHDEDDFMLEPTYTTVYRLEFEGSDEEFIESLGYDSETNFRVVAIEQLVAKED